MMSDYEKYQLQWMINHGYSLENLIDEMYDYARRELDPEHPYYPSLASTAIDESFNAVINDYGFGGELFVCEDEYNDEERWEEEN